MSELRPNQLWLHDVRFIFSRSIEDGLSAFFDDEPQMKAHFVGALLGYDFTNSPHLQGVQDDARQLRERGLFYLTQFVTALTRRAAVILMLDDLHWADRPSLDAILHLVRECPRLRLLVVCAARAALFQNHSDWDPLPAPDQAKAIRLDLEPLSRQASRQLVGEILHRVDDPPQAFCEQVVSTAEGNPFYVEELVKMLIDDGVIARDGITDVWHLDRQRIEHLEVPPTLTALLQARLDGLPEGEKQVMRQASVLGRVFWSAALQALQGGDEPPAAELMALSRRQLIDPQERSTFAQTDEYAFRQALMREVTYETVLKRARQAYHRHAAEWLAQITQAGGRSGEYAAVMAEHYRLAGETGTAAEWYVQAGERAQAQASPREARRSLDRALDLLPLSDRELRWRALLARDKALGALGETEARMADDAALVALAQEMHDDEKLATACLQQGYFVGITGHHDRELEIYKEGLAAAQRAGNQQLETSLLSMMVVCKTRLGDLHSAAATAEEALSHAQALGDEQTLVRTLTNTSVFYIESGDIAKAAMLLSQQVEINHRLGNREGEAVGLSNLGYNYLQLGLYQLGIDALQRSLELSEDIGHRLFSAYGRLNLGLAYLRTESIQSSQQVLTQGLSELTVINDPFGQAVGQSYLGLVKEQSGEISKALVLFSSAWAMLSEVGVQGYANDAQAGVARCLLAQGQLGDAQQQATDLSSHLAQNGSKGMEFPILAYQTCADVFEALGETEYARTMVGAGYRELMARASRISEPHWRKSFLENIPEHRRMMETWESSPP